MTAARPNGTPGCDDPECCEIVCESNPSCCDEEWDLSCADAAANLCGPLCVCQSDDQCDDGDACTDDGCDPDSPEADEFGCVHTPVDCDDGNDCTDDGCDSATGCTHIDNNDPCDDGNPCTTGDACGGGSCQPGAPDCNGDDDCADGNPCTDNTCDANGCCVTTNNNAGCDDGDACTDPDQCSDGACVGGPVLDCDDANPCTADNCNPETGECTNIPECENAADCPDDGDPNTRAVCLDGCCAQEPEDEAGCCSSRGRETSDCGGEHSAGNSVYLFSGEYYESVVDLQIAGRGLNFSWARKYRSKFGPHTAQGNGWDFSYNIRLEQDGGDFVLFDGNTRRDTYRPQRDGTWTVAEFFRVLTQNKGSSTLTFPDTSTWNFHPFDGSPQQGKISSSVDRNGNTISFDYDALGRLVIIHDPLDTPAHNRDITISYNADGFIESVTDFAGRWVTYEYYQDGDPGGSFGDLKSVTTPVVVKTPAFPIPAGHDYPDGKTTVYTYSTGLADERLNHNLLTITDPKGQTYLTTVYAETEDPGDFSFDRVVRQYLGDQDPVTGDIIDFVYDPLVPAAENDPDTQVIVNDRVGNVTEYFFTAQNVNVRQLEYTGRWDPDAPTFAGDLPNPPIPKLREDDPASFETRWEYNGDALSTRVFLPNGNEEVTTFDEGNASRRSQGNALQRCRLPGPLGGDQAQICESYEYDDGFGGCCGTNFVTRHVDGRGNETLHDYDASGNRTHTTHRIPSIVEDMEYSQFGQMTVRILPDNGSSHRRRDEYTYYDTGPQLGYLHEQIVDAPNFALTTTYEYNLVGQLSRMIDPRGHDMLYIVNQLDQIDLSP